MSDLTIAALAAEARSHFTQDTRNDGAKFWKHDCRDDDATAWIYELTRDAHGDMFPDDYRYEFIVEALGDIADGNYETADDARDGIRTESDIYTSDLLKWLSSDLNRLDYCDEYGIECSGDADSTLQRIAGGQYMEKREVLNAVLDALEAQMSVLANG